MTINNLYIGLKYYPDSISRDRNITWQIKKVLGHVIIVVRTEDHSTGCDIEIIEFINSINSGGRILVNPEDESYEIY